MCARVVTCVRMCLSVLCRGRRTVRSVEHIRIPTGHTSRVNAVAFRPNRQLLATGGSDQTARPRKPATGEHIRTLTGHTGGIQAVAFSPDGKLLTTGSSDQTVRLWD